MHWGPEGLDPTALDGIDAVVHLAGESIVGRWTPEKKDAIRQSRVRGTRILAEAMAQSANPPKTLVCASAIGYYGDRGDEILTESSAPGHDFLAEVCEEWEAAAEPALKKNIRVVFMRLGVVLSSEGGALSKMLTPFRMGVGGVIGNGKQYWSWIGLDDVVGAIQFALETPALRGPVNLVAPVPVTNREFTTALGRVLHRPTIFPLPGFVAKMLLGEMADALLLASARVLPEKLKAAGFVYRHPDLDGALQFALKKR